MNINISIEDANSKLSNLMTGCSIDKVTYFITGWEIRFIGNNGKEVNLLATDVIVQDEVEWWKKLGNFPIDLRNTNEASDTLTAIALFTVVNKWPVSEVEIDEECNLCLCFRNGVVVNVRALVEHVDWTWQINRSDGNNIVTCDSGDLYGNQEYFS